ncbi:ORF6N domain-containing protein [Enterococcus sp. DIV1420a]|uniref:ORF6N domain-containing protein n=1 Tax=Enterococcus sp. DIV1420a TaxID=2774672 RepID=UPI003F24D1EE
MNQPQIIELNNQRLLTTEQLAEFYGASETQIKQNFNNNKDKFVEGKHYYRLEGQELKAFKSQVENFDLPINKFASQLILYTKQGASRHSKMLNTDRAWDMYDELEENYFNSKPQINASDLSPELQFMNSVVQSLAKQEMANKRLENKVDNITDIIALNTTDWRKECRSLVNKMAKTQGEFGAYQEIQAAIYDEVDRRAGSSLKTRLTNLKNRMAGEGVSKSKRDKMNKLDVIDSDKRLKEIYLAVVKDFAIKYGIWK